jgi:hypothetical protein
VKTSRVQAAIKILKSSAEEFNLEEKQKTKKAIKTTKTKKVVKKTNKKN